MGNYPDNMNWSEYDRLYCWDDIEDGHEPSPLDIAAQKAMYIIIKRKNFNFFLISNGLK